MLLNPFNNKLMKYNIVILMILIFAISCSVLKQTNDAVKVERQSEILNTDFLVHKDLNNGAPVIPDIDFHPDSCYEKCLIQGNYGPRYFSFYEYTGDNPNLPGIKAEKIIMQQKRPSWRKERFIPIKCNNETENDSALDPECDSQYPNNCLMWDLKMGNELSYVFNIVIDTVSIKDYKVNNQFEWVAKREEVFKWTEVVCASDLNDELIRQIYDVLSVDFRPGKTYEGFSGQFQEALIEYQQIMDLPVGGINFKTLDHMGISKD